ncbi:replication factor A protein 2 [Mortierella sp. NVP85]|nr:replication factor A protein 2 [Mortierella sp. NVP85]
MSNYNRNQGQGGQGYITDSFSSDAGPTKKIVNHTLRPVTIKQLQKVQQTYSDGDFKIDGHPLVQVTFVGVVRGVNRQSTHHTYIIEDGTGSIDAKNFPSDDEDSPDTNGIVEGVYVRVVGVVRSFNNKFAITIISIRAIHDMNEITYHHLEVMLLHPSGSGSGMVGVTSTSHNNYDQPMTTSTGNVGGAGGGTEIREQIVSMIHSHPDRTTGVHRQEIINAFAPIIGGSDAVRAMLDTMVDGGFLFEGDDEDHLMTTY